MSLIIDSAANEVDMKDLLEIIANQLILLNERIEAAFETGIELEDIE
jgi:hypothetical protein